MSSDGVTFGQAISKARKGLGLSQKELRPGAVHIDGPLHEYFLGQFYFEKTGRWPFGERLHGYAGLQEAFADALGVPNKKESLLYYLRIYGSCPRTGRRGTGYVLAAAAHCCAIAIATT